MMNMMLVEVLRNVDLEPIIELAKEFDEREEFTSMKSARLNQFVKDALAEVVSDIRIGNNHYSLVSLPGDLRRKYNMLLVCDDGTRKRVTLKVYKAAYHPVKQELCFTFHDNLNGTVPLAEMCSRTDDILLFSLHRAEDAVYAFTSRTILNHNIYSNTEPIGRYEVWLSANNRYVYKV